MTLISPFMRSFVGVPTSHPIRNKAMIRGTLRKGFNVIKDFIKLVIDEGRVPELFQLSKEA